MESQEVFAALKSFVVNELLEGEEEGLDGSTPLLKLGLINSMSRLMLVRFINQRFGLGISNQDLTGPKVETLDRMTSTVVELLAQK